MDTEIGYDNVNVGFSYRGGIEIGCDNIQDIISQLRKKIKRFNC